MCGLKRLLLVVGSELHWTWSWKNLVPMPVSASGHDLALSEVLLPSEPRTPQPRQQLPAPGFCELESPQGASWVLERWQSGFEGLGDGLHRTVLMGMSSVSVW